MKSPDLEDALVQQIRPRQSYLRAANLELHQEQVEHYIPTGRALEVLRRLVNSIDSPAAGRAWSLTGPYGAGKSSFALFLHTLLGPDSRRRSRAQVALSRADPALCEALVSARRSLDADESGFVLATTTCQQEPLADSLLRALQHGTSGYWGRKRKPNAVVDSQRSASRIRSSRSIAAAVRELAKHAPVLLILDEFGKTLEHFASDHTDKREVASDLFVLQELAELATGRDALPSFIFTLQHLAFDDYVRHASAMQRREWGKIQGRFEDVSFLESAEQSLRLVAGALDDEAISVGFRRRRAAWSRKAYVQTKHSGIANHLPGGADTLAQCYPLHPVTLLALPQLCAQLGQHGRTLFSFLASAEPCTAYAFLTTTVVPPTGRKLPTLRLPELFDFFTGPGQALAVGVGGSRWHEVHERVREASTLPDDDVALVKTVGLLNLMGNASGLRASADLVAFSLSAPDGSPEVEWKAKLTDLESRGWLTYRSFADEYRLWQGSDVDLRGRVADAREQLRSTSAAELMTRLQPDNPVIAGKHSQRVGMLRYFTIRFADESSGPLSPLSASDPADGALVYYLGPAEATSSLRMVTADTRPMVLVTSGQAMRVRDAAVEVAAALAVLDQQEVIDDRVARRELQDRVADARSRMGRAFAEAFRPEAESVKFSLVGTDVALDTSQGVSRLLSDVCDEVYSQSPEIRNEMLGRRDLTSQGAKARRNLIEAMVEKPALERLGLEGYGPERAMYEAVLNYTGLHQGSANGSWQFHKPLQNGKLSHVWGAMTQFVNAAVDEPAAVDSLYQRLMSPPIGLKEGPIPVLLTAFLLHRPDDIAVYEEGSYQPSLTVEVLERLIKAPQRFAVKAFATAGARSRQLAAISKVTADLDVTSRPISAAALRNSTVLAVAAPLLRLVRGLPQYTLNTSALSPAALAVRDELLGSREPDVLLFEGLPAACGVPPTGRARAVPSDKLSKFATVLRSALQELQTAYDRQLNEVGNLLAEELELPVERLRTSLQERGALLDGKVLDRQLQTFLFNAADDSPDDSTWRGTIALAISGKPAELWRDEDRTRFRLALHETVMAFRRVEHVHFAAESKDPNGNFTARRISYTTPEGVERNRVVYYDDEMEKVLVPLAVDILARAQQMIGPHGRDGLAALLLEQVLPMETESHIGGLAELESKDVKRAQ